MHDRFLTRCLLGVAMGLAAVGPLAADSFQTVVTPSLPGTEDPVTIVVFGQSGSACVPELSSSSVAGDQIAVNLFVDPDAVCAAVLTDWLVEANVGTLPLGTYTVTVTVEAEGCQFFPEECLDSMTFDVVAPGGPGVVPATLRVEKTVSPRRIALFWSPSCSDEASDYGIYEGLLGDFGSHVPARCGDTSADLTEEIEPGAGSSYYLVVPHDGSREGSHGSSTAGVERQPLARCHIAYTGPTCRP